MQGAMTNSPEQEQISEGLRRRKSYEDAVSSASGMEADAPSGDGEEFEGGGGWKYRFNSDGSIEITGAPEGHRAGARLTGGTAFDAIKAEAAAAGVAAAMEGADPASTKGPDEVPPADTEEAGDLAVAQSMDEEQKAMGSDMTAYDAHKYTRAIEAAKRQKAGGA
jgi:hypothetical protein